MVDRRVPPASKTRRHFRTALWLALAAFTSAMMIIVFIVGNVNIQPHILGVGFEVIATALGIWLTLIILIWSKHQGRFDPFELPTFISLNAYGQMILATLLLNRNRVTSIPWLSSDPGPMMTLAVVLIGFCLTCMWIGYIWMSLRKTRKSRSQPSKFGAFRLQWTLVLWFITSAITFVSTTVGAQGWTQKGFTYVWANYISLIDLVALTSSFALALYHFRNPTARGWIWLSIMVITRIYPILFVGSRGAVFVFLGILMTYFYARRKLPIRWLAIGLVTVIILAPVGTAIRNNLIERDTGTGVGFANRVQVVGESFQLVASRSVGSLFAELFDLIGQRQATLLDITASVIFIHPKIQPFVGLDLLQSLVVQLIPRILWSAKPTSLALYDITGLYSGLPTGAFSAIGLFADSYRAGGWIASAIIMALIGVIGAWLYQLGPGHDDSAMIVIYLLVLTRLITYDNNLTTLVLDLIQKGIPIWLLVRFIMFNAAPVQAITPAKSHNSRSIKILP